MGSLVRRRDLSTKNNLIIYFFDSQIWKIFDQSLSAGSVENPFDGTQFGSTYILIFC